MFEPVRGGTRGGQAEFKWSDVSADKDRENYLGHSINAPTGRWQKNKDVHWYNRDVGQTEQDRLDEIKKIKEQEAEALSAALGFGPSGPSVKSGTASGANATAVGPRAGAETDVSPPIKEELDDKEKQRILEKEERRRRKAEKKAKKEKRRAERAARGGGDYDSDGEGERERRRYHGDRSRSPRSRSPAPRYRPYDREKEREMLRRARSRTRSRTPPLRQRGHNYRDAGSERDKDRRRWEDDVRRDAPGPRRGRDW